jgi:hypothetical protein
MFVEMVICDFPKGKYTITGEFIGDMLLFFWEGLQQIQDKALTCMSLHVPKKTTIVCEVHGVHSHSFYSNGQTCCKNHSGGDALVGFIRQYCHNSGQYFVHVSKATSQP